jgi:hypothetical protein
MPKESKYIGYRQREVVRQTKGYGFIQPDDSIKDVFVHINVVERASLRIVNEYQAASPCQNLSCHCAVVLSMHLFRGIRSTVTVSPVFLS